MTALLALPLTESGAGRAIRSQETTMATTNSYLITNTKSGAEIGEYRGATEAEALDAMARDQGYESYADQLATIDSDGADIKATLVECCYSVRILTVIADDTDTVRVSVLYDEDLDSDSAPAWDASDDEAVAAHLAAELHGSWELSGSWDAGDHPTRLEQISTWRRY